MVLTVRRDLFYANKKTANSENIQENVKSFVNNLGEKTNKNRKRKVLMDISGMVNIPAKHAKIIAKQQLRQLQMSSIEKKENQTVQTFDVCTPM